MFNIVKSRYIHFYCANLGFILTKKPVTCCIPECFGLMHFPAPHPSSLTLLSLHPLALQQTDVEPLLCVLVSDVLSGSQHLQRVPRRLDVTRWAHRSLVLHHLRGQPGERSEVKGHGQERKNVESHRDDLVRVVT